MTIQDITTAAKDYLQYGALGLVVIVLALNAWSMWNIQAGFDTRTSELNRELSRLEDTLLKATQNAAREQTIRAEKRLEIFAELMRDAARCYSGGSSGGNTGPALGNGSETPAAHPAENVE